MSFFPASHCPRLIHARSIGFRCWLATAYTGTRYKPDRTARRDCRRLRTRSRRASARVSKGCDRPCCRCRSFDRRRRLRLRRLSHRFRRRTHVIAIASECSSLMTTACMEPAANRSKSLEVLAAPDGLEVLAAPDGRNLQGFESSNCKNQYHTAAEPLAAGDSGGRPTAAGAEGIRRACGRLRRAPDNAQRSGKRRPLFSLLLLFSGSCTAVGKSQAVAASESNRSSVKGL
ncbi:hypothetical protein BRADI_4g27915v3 [Brachypodium distachyon]|uniref:Uncharacterized protein n=1 Tax=Brachypodium distachyon TaxID=15368 RepID=A0A2K2CQS7_BRADI|nr:hypothetical protein BRADI_4g27915v3 [Brachypodium distachyon]